MNKAQTKLIIIVILVFLILPALFVILYSQFSKEKKVSEGMNIPKTIPKQVSEPVIKSVKEEFLERSKKKGHRHIA